MSRLKLHLLPIATVLLVTFAAYFPGLRGPFLLDDVQITRQPAIAIQTLDLQSMRDAAFSAGTWYPRRGIARLSFALNYHLAGQRFDATWFKLTNVVIHAVNAVLVYALCVLLVGRLSRRQSASLTGASAKATQGYLPWLVAAVWSLHPVQLTGVLYVVQRMTSLSALFVFLGLLVFVMGRARVEDGRPSGWIWMIVGLAGGGLLGFLCKQSAALLPFFAFLTELFFFDRAGLSTDARRRLNVFYAVTVALPAVLALGGSWLAWDLLEQGYLMRDFSPVERLMTQSRVLWFYLGLLLIPYIRWFGFYHDDFVTSTGLLTPWTTLPSLALLVALLGLSLWGLRRRSLWSFAALWFLVGHALESSVIGLELVFEHRNYVPSFGVLFALCYYLAKGLESLEGLARVKYALLGVFVAVLSFTTFARAGIWAETRTMVDFQTRAHPRSYRAQLAAASLMVSDASPAAETYAAFQRAAALDDRAIYPLVEMARIALGVRIAVGDPGPLDTTAGSAQLSLLADPLSFDAERVARLESLIDTEIRRRLAVGAMKPSNVTAMERLAQCGRRRIDVCVRLLPRLESWLRAALANDRLHSRTRAALEFSLARLYASMGDVDAAMEHAELAAAARPRDVLYRYHQAKLAMAMNRWPEAERIIEQIERGSYRSVSRDDLIERLRREHARRGRQSSGD